MILNLALRPILESVGRAEMAAHCPVNPASLSSYDGQSNKSDFLDFGEGDMMVNQASLLNLFSGQQLFGVQRGFRDLFGNRSVDSGNLRLATANTPGYYSHLAKVRMSKVRIIS